MRLCCQRTRNSSGQQYYHCWIRPFAGINFLWGVGGAWTKRTSKLKANGNTCIGRLTLQCQTIDFLLTARRDAAAALRFFRKAIRHHGVPEVVTIDKSGTNTAALATLNADKPDEESITVRQSKYLNNLVEQDHRNIKRQTRLMLGFKSFRRAQTLLAGIELLNMIRKGQYQHPGGARLSPADVGCLRKQQRNVC